MCSEREGNPRHNILALFNNLAQVWIKKYANVDITFLKSCSILMHLFTCAKYFGLDTLLSF